MEIRFKAGPHFEDLEMKKKEWRAFPEGEPHEERYRGRNERTLGEQTVPIKTLA